MSFQSTAGFSLNALFGALGDSAVYTDSALNESTIDVVIALGQEVIGEYATAVGYLDTLSVKTSDANPRPGDTFTIATGSYAGTWIVVGRLATDGFTSTFEVTKQ